MIFALRGSALLAGVMPSKLILLVRAMCCLIWSLLATEIPRVRERQGIFEFAVVQA